MKFSIVTISFNQAAYLERCICSVIEQRGVDLDYVIVDPGSTDGSREIIERYRNSFSHVVLEPDNGPADGLNKGFALASGDVYGFLNSDDELLPDALARVAAAMTADPRLEILSGCGYFIDGQGNRLRAVVSSRLTPWLYAHGGTTIFQQGTFFRADRFHEVGGFNRNNGTCWDAELFLDMAMAGAKCGLLAQDLALFRLHGQGITGSGRLAKQYRVDSARLFEKATGHPRRRIDGVLGLAARIAKFFADPRYSLTRLRSTFTAR